jgi:transcription elongation factor Elf1
MKDKNTEYVKCPFCKSVVEVDVAFAKKNGRVFCGACCKSFDIRIEEDDEPEEPVKKPIKDDFDYWN